MEELEWFVSILENEFDVKVEMNQISYEGNELYLDEIDESLIPREMFEDLPESLLFETMLIEDQQGTEWLGIIALHPETYEWCLQMILKDGVPVLRRLVDKENLQ
ncbi:hypothetical protein [Peribacillus acanthi]|uniref:hypothetical protein n=1 Tax=Peribacillus acanthi TaxID=2171554 RepID=UPI000D3E49CC|nr:hypothetical protein [Peribacillus acanthi]